MKDIVLIKKVNKINCALKHRESENKKETLAINRKNNENEVKEVVIFFWVY